MVVALFIAAGTASVAIPFSDGHIPEPAGFVPQTVMKPKRTCASSWVITASIAPLSLDQAVLVRSEQTASPVLPLRQWNMLPDRSTSRVTVGILGTKVYLTSVQVLTSPANFSTGPASKPPTMPPVPGPGPGSPPVPELAPEPAPGGPSATLAQADAAARPARQTAPKMVCWRGAIISFLVLQGADRTL